MDASKAFRYVGPHTDRKSLFALLDVGPESEAESVRFHGRKVTKVGPEVKRAAAGGLGAAEERVREAATVICRPLFLHSNHASLSLLATM